MASFEQKETSVSYTLMRHSYDSKRHSGIEFLLRLLLGSISSRRRLIFHCTSVLCLRESVLVGEWVVESE
jgi:hypothetical protein